MCDPDSVPYVTHLEHLGEVVEDIEYELFNGEKVKGVRITRPVHGTEDYDEPMFVEPEDIPPLTNPKLWVVVSDPGYDDYSIECICASEQDAQQIAHAFGYEVEEMPIRTPDDIVTWYRMEAGLAADILGGHSSIIDKSHKTWREDCNLPPAKWCWTSRNRQPEGFPDGWIGANELGRPEQHLNGILQVQGTDRKLVLETFNSMWLHINDSPQAFLYTIPWQTAGVQ